MSDPSGLILLLVAFTATLWLVTFHFPLNEATEQLVHGLLRRLGIERPHSPVEALLGVEGRLERPFRGDPPASRVRLRGESWRARCRSPLTAQGNRAGARIRVVGGSGNLLEVTLVAEPWS
jgi:membrane protein implicated in regulation of membrane protease activity